MTKNFTINCLNIKTKNDWHFEVKKTLNFPDYYGNDLDALLDCLRDLGWELKKSTDPEKRIEINFINFGNCIKNLTEDFNVGIFSVFNFWKLEYPVIQIKVTFEL